MAMRAVACLALAVAPTAATRLAGTLIVTVNVADKTALDDADFKLAIAKGFSDGNDFEFSTVTKEEVTVDQNGVTQFTEPLDPDNGGPFAGVKVPFTIRSDNLDSIEVLNRDPDNFDSEFSNAVGAALSPLGLVASSVDIGTIDDLTEVVRPTEEPSAPTTTSAPVPKPAEEEEGGMSGGAVFGVVVLVFASLGGVGAAYKYRVPIRAAIETHRAPLHDDGPWTADTAKASNIESQSSFAPKPPPRSGKHFKTGNGRPLSEDDTARRSSTISVQSSFGELAQPSSQ